MERRGIVQSRVCNAVERSAEQRQKAVTAYFTSKQLQLFAIAEANTRQCQTAVTAYFTSKDLLLLGMNGA